MAAVGGKAVVTSLNTAGKEPYIRPVTERSLKFNSSIYQVSQNKANPHPKWSVRQMTSL